MKKIIYTLIVAILSLLALASCGKDIFHSGEMVLDGTTVRYLVDVEHCTINVTAEGTIPNPPIFWRLVEVNPLNQCYLNRFYSRIDTIPYEIICSLSDNCEYSLWLVKDGKTISFGQFNL